MLIYVNITDKRTDKHIKSMVPHNIKFILYFKLLNIYKIFIKHSKDMFISNMSRVANIQRHDL